MLIKGFKVCRLIRMSTDEVTLEAGGFGLAKVAVLALLCVFFMLTLPQISLHFFQTWTSCFTVSTSLYFCLHSYILSFCPASLVLFVFQSVIYP